MKLILMVSGWHGKNRNRIKLSKGYFYHKAQNSWEVKKNPKICNTSLPFYPSKRIRNPQKWGCSWQTCCPQPWLQLKTFPSFHFPPIVFRPACTAHCLSDMLGQLRRWQKSGNKQSAMTEEIFSMNTTAKKIIYKTSPSQVCICEFYRIQA